MSNSNEITSRKREGLPHESKNYDLSFAYSFNWENEEDIREALKVLLCNNEIGQLPRKTRTYRELQARKDNAALEAARIRWLLAINPNTPPPVLDHLTHNSPSSMLERIAEHPRAHSTTLIRLANHEDGQVRAAVTENINTPMKVLWRLSRDTCPDVRLRIAEGYHVPFAILNVLVEDENPFVAERAKKTISRLLCEVAEIRAT